MFCKVLESIVYTVTRNKVTTVGRPTHQSLYLHTSCSHASHKTQVQKDWLHACMRVFPGQACSFGASRISQVAPPSTLMRSITLATTMATQTRPRMSIMMPTTTQPAWPVVIIPIPLKMPLKADATDA